MIANFVGKIFFLFWFWTDEFDILVVVYIIVEKKIMSQDQEKRVKKNVFPLKRGTFFKKISFRKWKITSKQEDALMGNRGSWISVLF